MWCAFWNVSFVNRISQCRLHSMLFSSACDLTLDFGFCFNRHAQWINISYIELEVESWMKYKKFEPCQKWCGVFNSRVPYVISWCLKMLERWFFVFWTFLPIYPHTNIFCMLIIFKALVQQTHHSISYISHDRRFILLYEFIK